jgi:hypothetical protein
MNGYIGQTPVDVKDTPYKDFAPIDWAMEYIERYGQIDGSHHKQWVLDQVARILKGTPIVIEIAKWDNGHKEYRFWTGSPSDEYTQWVIDMKAGEDGENTYGYDEGIAP